MKTIATATKRKRSQAAGITAIGLVGMLSGCGSPETAAAPVEAPKGDTHTAYVYSSAAQCAKEGSFSKAKCEEGYAAALKEQKETGKNFASKQECESEHGEEKCQKRSGGRFAALMAGYFIGRSSDGSKYSYSGLYNDRKSGGLVTGSSSWMNNGKPEKYSIAANEFAEKTSPNQLSRREKTRLAVASRGGFGGNSSAEETESVRISMGG
jgi:uncharacterized protein YgiB involved in biofilm formation